MGAPAVDGSAPGSRPADAVVDPPADPDVGVDADGGPGADGGPDVDVDTVPVVVVGAGPTGLVAATLLARLGVRCLLVERHRDVYPLPRAVHLDDEAVRILQQAGVADRFVALSRPARGMRLVDPALATIVEFRRDAARGEHGWPQANLFDQPDLERLLRENLRAELRVTFRGGTEVVGLDADAAAPRAERSRTEGSAGGRAGRTDGDDGRGHGRAPVRVRLRDTATGAERDVHAEAVLGCDGANSVVRAAIGSTMRDLGFAQRWLVVDVRCSADLGLWDGVHQVCDPHRAATYLRVGADRHRWEFRLLPGERAEDLDVPALLAPWTGPVPAEALEVLRDAEYTFSARVADRWRSGRVFLLGDAAHLSPPFIGQGLGAGVRDAANLAWKLARVLAGHGDERLLATYHAERGPHVVRVIRMAVLIGRGMTCPRPLALVRDAVLGRLGRSPAVARQALTTISPRLRGGPLVRRRGDRLAGRLCPQVPVAHDGRTARLDEVVGTGFALVHTGTLHPAAARLADRLGATVLPAGPGEALAEWLGRHGADAAVLRPDRVVLVSSRRPRRASGPRVAGQGLTRGADAWLPLLAPARAPAASSRAPRRQGARRAGVAPGPHNGPMSDTRRYFFDSEFIEDGVTIDLVSIGVVDEHGREFYAVSTEFDPDRAIPWVRRNVLDKLPGPASPAWRSRERIRTELLDFLTEPGEEIELWAWYAAYDHVVLCQLWGAMPALPRPIPRFTKDLRQRWDDLGRPALPAAGRDRHDALADARHNLARWQAMEQAHEAGPHPVRG